MAVTGKNPKQMAQGDTITGPLKITKIVVKGMTTAGHLMEFLDAAGGNLVAEFIADAANFTDTRVLYGPDGQPGLPVPNLYCNDLDSGENAIYLK